MTSTSSTLIPAHDTSSGDAADLAALQSVLDAMPPVRAMRIQALGWQGERLRLQAPLSANVNDKACAFGGSMASIMTLAGWGHCWWRARQAGWNAEIFVADSDIAYQKPLHEDLLAEAWLDEASQWPDLLQTGRERGRCRAILHARLLNQAGETVCRMRARYALIATAKD